MADIFVDEYERTRDISHQSFHSGCYAPYTSLYFDTRGNVRVCCHNASHSVGNISTQTLDEIWNGPAIEILRAAVKQYDLSKGCNYCEWQLASRSYANIKMRKWDIFSAESLTPRWPQMMEFSTSNVCNLECIMCDGEHSALIRANREKRPPLVNPYTQHFFDQLNDYLPHLKRAKFLGGEPFLQPSCYKIWEMMIVKGLKPWCHVTTNGSTLDHRVKSVLDQLPFSISISVDAARSATYESIRINATHANLLKNIQWFRAYTTDAKTSFALTYCLMRNNWEEFGEFCQFADGLGAPVGVNLVRKPSHLSLYSLPHDELHKIVNCLDSQSAFLLKTLKKNRAIWIGEVERLRQHALGNIQAPKLIKIAVI